MDQTLSVLAKHYQDKRNQIIDALSRGAARDYAEYRALCGEVRGLLIAESYVQDLAKNLESADE